MEIYTAQYTVRCNNNTCGSLCNIRSGLDVLPRSKIIFLRQWLWSIRIAIIVIPKIGCSSGLYLIPMGITENGEIHMTFEIHCTCKYITKDNN